MFQLHSIIGISDGFYMFPTRRIQLDLGHDLFSKKKESILTVIYSFFSWLWYKAVSSLHSILGAYFPLFFCLYKLRLHHVVTPIQDSEPTWLAPQKQRFVTRRPNSFTFLVVQSTPQAVLSCPLYSFMWSRMMFAPALGECCLPRASTKSPSGSIR